MHLIVLLAVVVVLAFDSGVRPFGADGALDSPWIGAVVALGTPMAFLLLSALAARPHRDGRHHAAALRRCDRIIRFGPWTAIAAHVVATFGLGWVTAVRAVVGDVILVDEAIAVLPPLASIVAIWCGTWPVERLVRGWTLLRQLDRVEPGSPPPRWDPSRLTPSFWPYLGHQIRTHILLVLIPIMVAVGMSEWGRGLVAHAWPRHAEAAQPWISLGAVGTALLATPLLVRWALGLRSLPPGELRDDLLGVCAAHGVRVRDILVWPTGDTMLNGAVLGLVGPLRHVLLTDALLRTLSRPMLLTVMAHEIGHIRRRHLPWLAAAALAGIWLGGMLAWLATLAMLAVWTLLGDGAAVVDRDMSEPFGGDDWLIAIEIAIGLAAALLLLGWVSRRLEWQADAFAATHLSRFGAGTARAQSAGEDAEIAGGGGASGEGAGAGAEARISPESIDTVCAALETVTVAAGGDPTARSWRHGSIRHRQRRLRALDGAPVRDLPIDRTVTRLKFGVAAIVLVAGASLLLPEPQGDASAPSDRSERQVTPR